MRVRALPLCLFAVFAVVCAPLAAQSGDTFEIHLTAQGHGAATQVVHLLGDELEAPQCCSITVTRSGDAVATFQSHQVALVINRTAGGEREFEIFQLMGERLHVRADRMVPDLNGLIFFYTGGRVVGVTNQNAARMVIDAGSRVDTEGRPISSRPRWER